MIVTTNSRYQHGILFGDRQDMPERNPVTPVEHKPFVGPKQKRKRGKRGRRR